MSFCCHFKRSGHQYLKSLRLNFWKHCCKHSPILLPGGSLLETWTLRRHALSWLSLNILSKVVLFYKTTLILIICLTPGCLFDNQCMFVYICNLLLFPTYTILLHLRRLIHGLTHGTSYASCRVVFAKPSFSRRIWKKWKDS